MSPKPDVSQKRKHQILDAATEVFSRKGIDQATMDDLVEEAGLSKGTLYWYFKSKDDIIIAILDRLFQRELDQLAQIEVDRHSALESVVEFSEQVISDMKGMLRLMPIAYEFIALAFRSKVVQEALSRYFDRYLKILIPIIQRGIDRGEFRRVRAEEVAIVAAAIFEGTIQLWVYDKSQVDPERHIRSGIQLLLEGLVVKEIPG